MKSSTRLESIIFQLTPTRTRCDLVITANGKTEKIASGLLNPFLAHLKSAQDQIGKGGYSIVLEPNRGSDAAWFTKGTVERFVRFVSTPEILERVYTIESEILQIEKAISIQRNNDNELNSEDYTTKSVEINEGSKLTLADNDEKAIVLYQPSGHSHEEDKSTTLEKNSKVQLVRVLETRKTVLQKEQGMAFARAVAATFDLDNIAALLAFAECFGAFRMRDACKRFVDLWKAKHENGQWVEVEATEAMSCHVGLPSTNASGIVLVNSNEQREVKSEVTSEKNGISCSAGTDHQGQPIPQDYSPGQFSHPMFPHWQMHPQANGLPIYPPYPMQGMPYYQNCPGNGPFFQPPYPAFDDSRLDAKQRTRRRRHSMDSREMSTESENQEFDGSEGKILDDIHTDEEDSAVRRARRKDGKGTRKQSGTVVIRNINYIASAKHGSSGSDPESEQDSGADDMEGNMRVDEIRKSKKKANYPKEERMSGQAGDDGHWQAFQNFLLNDADETNDSARSNMFVMEGKVQGRRQAANGDASAFLGGRNMGENRDADISECRDIAGDRTCMRKPMDDQMLRSRMSQNGRATDSQTNSQFEAGDRRRPYRSADTNMDYMINRQQKLTDIWDSSLDPVISNGFQGPPNSNNGGSSHGVHDESFMILQRSGSLDQVATDGRTIKNMDYELPSLVQKPENHAAGIIIHEPNDLNLMPDRAVEDGISGYDPALDYEFQGKVATNLNSKKEISKGAKEGPRKGVKDQKLKAGTRREKPSKLSPAEDARARAERLRAYKADLQKLKKEKEAEQLKRLEALKLERQKRIAARSGANPPQSPLPSQQAKKQLPKLSPVSQKGSKFSDTEPGSSSPLQRSTLKTVSRLPAVSSKGSKSSKLNSGSTETGNRLTRSASSLSVRKEENNGFTPESKATMARIRRFSEPKAAVHHFSSGKTRSAEPISKRVSEGHAMKKFPSTTKLDKTKSAALSDSKLRASKGSSASAQKKSTSDGMLRKSNDKLPSVYASANSCRENAKFSSTIDGDDGTVVEKTVVMLECEKPSTSVPHAEDDKIIEQNLQYDAYNLGGKSEEDVAVPPPASPITVKEIDREPHDVRAHLNETRADSAENILRKIDGDGPEKPYQAPYARVSSLEDPCMVKSDYGKAPPRTVEVASARVEASSVDVPNIPRQDVVEVSEAASLKHRGKESSKGFRRLLKFGKKNSTVGESNVESDKASIDGSVADDIALDGPSSEVFTLKNLLIQEESSSANTTPKKSSRSFSLLSPFRSKTGEKKLST